MKCRQCRQKERKQPTPKVIDTVRIVKERRQKKRKSLHS